MTLNESLETERVSLISFPNCSSATEAFNPSSSGVCKMSKRMLAMSAALPVMSHTSQKIKKIFPFSI